MHRIPSIKLSSLASLTEHARGWIVQCVGQMARSQAMITAGRSRQLRATVALRSAHAKAAARSVMQSWQLRDLRLLPSASLRSAPVTRERCQRLPHAERALHVV